MGKMGRGQRIKVKLKEESRTIVILLKTIIFFYQVDKKTSVSKPKMFSSSNPHIHLKSLIRFACKDSLM